MNLRELTRRERILAIVCVGAAAVMMLRYGVIEPMGGMPGSLDREIAQAETTLTMLTEAAQLVKWVDEDYERYSVMMSDESSDEEVRNNLQEEIFKLAKQAVVSVSTIKQGSTEPYKYYKQYLVTFAIEGAPDKIAHFLKLLEDSPKLLHVEKMNIDRRGDMSLKGQLTVSRSLVASADHDAPKSDEDVETARQAQEQVVTRPQKTNMVVNGGFEAWDKGYESARPNGWKGWGTTSVPDQDHKVEGNFAVKIGCIKAGGNFIQNISLESGMTYTWSAEAAIVNGAASIYLLDASGRIISKTQYGTLNVSGPDMRYYEQRFTVPGRSGAQRRMRLQMSLSKPGAIGYVDNVTLYKGADY